MQRKDVVIPLSPPFVDERGEIQNLAEAAFGSALVITSRAGAIRANHYHKTDFHYCWLQRGRVVYYYRPVESQSAPIERTVGPGEVFYTPPMEEHAMRFLEDSVMLCFARNSRAMANYEADTVRVRLIS
jgi:dTDP-4-dehydrorhamnose 3,5-epimerase-like enzyme